MDVLEKAKILGESGRYDSCGPAACDVKVDSGLGGIYHAKAEHKTCRLFKTLMSNSCSFDCRYCGNAAGCKKKKAAYEPNELARLFMHLKNELDVEGLFLSSAVSGNPDAVTEKMLEAVKLLRFRHHFRGYIHFKVLPGTSYELIRQASELSTRMSINIEAPSKEVLSELSSCKDFRNDLLKRQAWISRMKMSGGQTTQVIVNNLATDEDILKMTDWEYNSLKLRRVYYSAFSPVKGTPLEDEQPVPQLRENRLYNVDFLLREYNFKLKEFRSIMDSGMLPREDPKLALAKQNFDSPVDINSVGYDELIRVPGIGPKTAQRIIEAKSRIRSYSQLDMLGGHMERAKPFIKINGERQQSLGAY